MWVRLFSRYFKALMPALSFGRALQGSRAKKASSFILRSSNVVLRSLWLPVTRDGVSELKLAFALFICNKFQDLSSISKPKGSIYMVGSEGYMGWHRSSRQRILEKCRKQRHLLPLLRSLLKPLHTLRAPSA
jgi:hypothetical protein